MLAALPQVPAAALLVEGFSSSNVTFVIAYHLVAAISTFLFIEHVRDCSRRPTLKYHSA
jgi:hypothetical protein